MERMRRHKGGVNVLFSRKGAEYRGARKEICGFAKLKYASFMDRYWVENCSKSRKFANHGFASSAFLGSLGERKRKIRK